MLTFDSFYNGFMAPFFSCYRCDDAIQGLQAIDMDSSGEVDWSEFQLYLRWALNQYPKDIECMEDLLDVVFRKGLIPSMRDEIIRKEEMEAKLEEEEERRRKREEQSSEARG